MPYADIEQSREDGRPVVFYRFTLGAVVWRYTSADQDITADGYLWSRAAMSDDGVRQSSETSSDIFTIDAPWWIGPAQVFMGGAPSQAMQVVKLEKHEQNPEMIVKYVGEVVQVNYPFPGQARISCETLLATMDREGLRFGWQRGCPYQIFDPATCRLNKASQAATFTVLALDGFTLTAEFASVPADGTYDGGFVEWTHPIRGLEVVAIDTQVGSVLSLFADPGDLHPGVTGTAYKVCRFEPVSCQALGNYDNYGGNPDMPGKSPFDGDPVF